jgi:putative DNA primase/helicase
MSKRFCTDDGNALRFVDRAEGNFLYVDTLGWHRWNETRWEPLSETLVINWAAEVVAPSIWEEMDTAEDEDEEKLIKKWALESQSMGRLNAMVRLARGKLWADTTDMDAHPWLLNLPNGIVDLRTGVLHQHDRKARLTQIAPTPYREGAQCPKWLAFLRWMCCGDEGLMGYLQRWTGYCLTGDVGQQALCILHGSTGANGKSTYCDVVKGLLGSDYSAPAPAGFLMRRANEEHPTSIWQLRGRRFIYASETEDDARLDSPRIKVLTGETTLTARGMHQDFSQFTATAKFTLLTNPRPIFDGADKALLRRLHLVPCMAHRALAERVNGLAEAILQEEREGILQWALAGLDAMLERGQLHPAARMEEELEDYRADMDKLGQWLDESCLLGSGYSDTSKGLYADYSAWVKARGECPLGKTSWQNKMKERQFEPCRIGHDQHRGWRGLTRKVQ